MQRVNYAPVAGRPDQWQTYKILSPADIEVVAACRDVGCEQWRDGWDTIIDERTELGARQAAYIRGESGRTFREMTTGAGWTVFRFESGQRCFREHHTRPEMYGVVAGVNAQQGQLIRRHTRPADWVEDIGEQLDNIRAARERG